jgi:pimeloyl-ACP methyl ester carboxylesterase
MITSVRSGSAVLAVERSGNGPSLVCLHAGVADRRMFAAQARGLGHAFTIVRYDRRGFGETRTRDEAFSHGADLAAVIEGLGVADPILLGCSQGGRIAVDFALAHPGKVRGLILISSAISGAPATPLPGDLQPLEDALEAAEEAGDLATVNAIEAHLWLDGPRSVAGRVGGAARDLFLAMNRIALAHGPLTREQEPAPAFERLPALRMPVLLMHGTLDFPHVVSRHEQLAALIPGARSVACEGNAHLPSFENPSRVNAEILDFCQDRGLMLPRGSRS